MSITFNAICELLEDVEKHSIRRPKLTPEREQSAIRRTISDWFNTNREAIDHPDTNGGALLSALFPHRRKDRVYGIQVKSLSKKILKILNIKQGQQSFVEDGQEGLRKDFGAYMEDLLAPRDGTFRNPPKIPLDCVNRLLVQMAAKSRHSDAAIQTQRVADFDTDEELKYVVLRLTSWETKWLIRLLLREYCTLQLDEAFIFRTYHFLLPDLLVFQNDFDAAVQLLRCDLKSFPPVPNAGEENHLRIAASNMLRAVVGTKVGRPTFHKAWSFKNCFQLVGDRAWAAEVKYDGEYCEIHIDLQQADNIKIFSKNGKDATRDRQGLHEVIRRALRIGHPDCPIKRNCILLGEMVIYSDKEQRILPFCKIRKHISRAGSFMGTLQDSLPHAWEHLMIVFFDILVMDDKPILRKCLQERRCVLREVVQYIPGRACRSEWFLVDFKTEEGRTDLKQAFAESLALRQEGLILKPLHTPYFPLFSDVGHRHRGYFVKLKKDYLVDMGGERDLGDFAIVGGSFDPQVAAKLEFKPLHWTHFHLGCLTNKTAVKRLNATPRFKVVGTVSIDKCISKPDARYLNMHGRLRQVAIAENCATDHFEVQQSLGYGPKMTAAFKKPFVAEILGGGYEQLQNETFEMLRHPRVRKIHQDRTWEDTVTMEELRRMAEAKWDVPDADKLDGHAKDVALLVRKYVKQMGACQAPDSEQETTQETTQCTTPRTSQSTPHARPQPQMTPDDAVVQETQQTDTQSTWTTTSTTQFCGSTQGNGIKASFTTHMLVREDTSEKIPRLRRPQFPQADTAGPVHSPARTSPASKRQLTEDIVSPPSVKRRKARTPLKHAGSKANVATFECDSQEKTVHVYAEPGWRIEVHEK